MDRGGEEWRPAAAVGAAAAAFWRLVTSGGTKGGAFRSGRPVSSSGSEV